MYYACVVFIVFYAISGFCFSCFMGNRERSSNQEVREYWLVRMRYALMSLFFWGVLICLGDAYMTSQMMEAA